MRMLALHEVYDCVPVGGQGIIVVGKGMLYKPRTKATFPLNPSPIPAPIPHSAHWPS